MPRDRKTQPPQAPNAQAYGMRGDQMAAQRAMPLPQSAPPPLSRDIPTGPPPGPPPQMGQPAPPAAPPMAAEPQINPEDPTLLALAQQFDPGITPLGAPTDRPNEPVTTGLSTGPGPGPEIFKNPSRNQRAAEVLRMLSFSSGNESYASLADMIDRNNGLI